MKHGKIIQAEQEAYRFLNYVKAMRKRSDADPYFQEYSEITGFKETSAIRRASLDLTRALAEMRKP